MLQSNKNKSYRGRSEHLSVSIVHSQITRNVMYSKHSKGKGFLGFDCGATKHAKFVGGFVADQAIFEVSSKSIDVLVAYLHIVVSL